MPSQIVESPAAIADVNDIADYLVERANAGTALRFLLAIREDYRRLAEFPGTGALRDYNVPGLEDLRMLPVSGFPNHLIFYQANDNELIIRRVLHGARDLDAIFSNPE